MSEKINNELLNSISKNKEDLPFISRFWEITVLNSDNSKENNNIIFGKYNSSLENSSPFYKPYCKLFDLRLIENDEQQGI